MALNLHGLKPCPFCGSANVDPAGWCVNDLSHPNAERSGPACEDCNASADTVDIWNCRPGRMARAIRSVRWAVGVFGEIANSPQERIVRFLEEAIELAHAAGISLPMMMRLLARVYDRPAGDVSREIAQTSMTFDAVAAVLNVDPDAAAEIEFERVSSLPVQDRRASHRDKVEAGIAFES